MKRKASPIFLILPGVDCAPWEVGGCVWLGERGRRTWGEGGSPQSQSPPGCRAGHLYERYLKTIHWRRRVMLLSPLCWVWPLGVTLSLGSMDSGFTASVTENGFLENLWKYGKLHPDKVHWGKICRLFCGLFGSLGEGWMGVRPHWVWKKYCWTTFNRTPSFRSSLMSTCDANKNESKYNIKGMRKLWMQTWI